MARLLTIRSLQFFLIFIILLISTSMAAASTFKSQGIKEEEEDECEYEIVVNTGRSKGPNYKLWVVLIAKGGDNISTSDFIREWGDMSRYFTYFSPNSESGFIAAGPCLKTGFCNIKIGGGKRGVELKPHWFINNITVITRGERVGRVKTFHFHGAHHNVAHTNPTLSFGSCPSHHKTKLKRV